MVAASPAGSTKEEESPIMAAEEKRRPPGAAQGEEEEEEEEEEAPSPSPSPSPERRLALRFQRGFLAGRRLAELPWEDLGQMLKNSRDSSPLLAILQKHELTAAEPLDELYEALGDVLNAAELMHFYKSYLLPSGDAVTLGESTAIISQGTTGLVTWDAGLYLAEWAMENSAVFCNRSILELGSGIGLTGITICKVCRPKAYVFSDHHPCVLRQLSENICLNGFFLESDACGHGSVKCKNRQAELAELQSPDITIVELDWNSVTNEQLHNIGADVVIAADVVYDPELTESLISVLRKFAACSSGKLLEVYITFTVRNPDTYRHFQKELDKVGLGWQIIPGPQKNCFSYDQHANLTIVKVLI